MNRFSAREGSKEALGKTGAYDALKPIDREIQEKLLSVLNRNFEPEKDIDEFSGFMLYAMAHKGDESDPIKDVRNELIIQWLLRRFRNLHALECTSRLYEMIGYDDGNELLEEYTKLYDEIRKEILFESFEADIE